MNVKSFFALGVGVLVSGCGGSGVQELSFADLDALAFDLEEEHIDTYYAADYTDPATLPDSGNPSYSGVIGLGGERASLIEEMVFVGQMSVIANFANDTVTGTASNFYETYEGDRFNGTLDIDMAIDKDVDILTNYTMSGDMSGVLEGTTDDVTVGIEAGLLADFYGANPDVIIGFAGGTYDSSLASSLITLNGTFWLEAD